MSAFLSHKTENQISIITDGAIYDSNAVVIKIGKKISASNTIPFAIAGRGNHFFCKFLAQGIIIGSDGKSVDDAFKRAQEMTDRLKEDYKEMDNPPLFDFIMAGYSETKGACHYYATNVPGWGEPYVWRSNDSPSIGGGPEISQIELIAAGITPEKIKKSGDDAMRVYGADIMELMRRKLGTSPNSKHIGYHHAIGGQCNLTTVTQYGAVTECLQVWDDPIGEPINPFKTAMEAA